MSHAIAYPLASGLATLTDLERAFFGYLADYKGGTRDGYERHLQNYFTWCQLHQVDPLAADRTILALYVRYLDEERGLRGSSVSSYMSAVKGFYKWSFQEGYIDRDPAVHVRLPKVEYRSKPPLERYELKEIRKAAKEIGGRHWALAELLLVHALRISECTNILIENYRPGTFEKWGLGYDRLSAINPRLVLVRVSGFGQTGPYRDRAGFGTLAEAMTGIVAAAAPLGERPRVLPYALADVMAGHLGAIAVLAAVRRRERTGRGTIIDLAIYEAALKLIELDLLECSVAGRDGLENAGLSSAASPRGTYRCGDGGWLALAASTQAVAERVLTAVGGAELVADPRFATNTGRLAHSDELDAVISRWCAARHGPRGAPAPAG